MKVYKIKMEITLEFPFPVLKKKKKKKFATIINTEEEVPAKKKCLIVCLFKR